MAYVMISSSGLRMSSGFNGGNVFIFLFIGVFIFIIVSNLAQWQKNNASPVLTVAAQVVDKRKKRHHHNNGNHSHTTTSYHITFKVKSGDTMDFTVKRVIYKEVHEEMVGKLTFQGSRYISFEG